MNSITLKAIIKYRDAFPAHLKKALRQAVRNFKKNDKASQEALNAEVEQHVYAPIKQEDFERISNYRISDADAAIIRKQRKDIRAQFNRTGKK